VTHALIEKCWDDETGVFWDLWGKEEQPIKVLTVAAIFPLILEDLEPAVAKRLVEDHLLEPAEFWTRYPVPSVSADEPSFDPGSRGQGLWRGPSAVNLNWYLYDGLRRHGYPDVARELAQRTFDLVSRSGMRQLFNPLTGEGLGAQSFGWDALVLDLLASESQG
ncbi:MAG: glycogen debranching protein, partial [Chloroflexi bacterium]|nr:glycogen debranching protein [Chloroflexota bacterium]